MKRYIHLLLSLAATLSLTAADWRWSAPVTRLVSDENGAAPEGFLWIDPACAEVRALMFGFQNMNEETLFSSERFRGQMAREGVALLWIAPGFGQEWDVTHGVQDAFDTLLKDLAAVSGHAELTSVSLIPFGHSAQATMPWNFAAWNPDRTLCLISYHGDAPRTNLCGYGRSNIEWGRTRNIDGIPALMVMGEYEWWDARLRPAMAFRMMYPGSCVSFLGDAGRGHFDLSERTADYMALFIGKSLASRLTTAGLVKIDPADGWMAESWHPGQTERHKAAPWADYDGCRHESFWYFDEEMARLTEERYAETKGKRQCWLGFVNNDGSLADYNPKGHCKTQLRIKPDENDCFAVNAVFTDSLRSCQAAGMEGRPVIIRYVSGPAIQTGNGTFSVDRRHPTWSNPKRRGRVTLCAESPSTEIYKETVQEVEVIIE